MQNSEREIQKNSKKLTLSKKWIIIQTRIFLTLFTYSFTFDVFFSLLHCCEKFEFGNKFDFKNMLDYSNEFESFDMVDYNNEFDKFDLITSSVSITGLNFILQGWLKRVQLCQAQIRKICLQPYRHSQSAVHKYNSL